MRLLSIYLLALFFIGCNAPRAVHDFDENVQFSNYTTYQIYPDLRSNLSQLDEQRLINILEERLPQKGLTLSNASQLYVNFYATEFETPSRNNVGIGVGGTGRNVGIGVSGGIPLGGPENNLQLTIDFIDVKSDSLVWQAIVETSFDRDMSPARRSEKLAKIVDAALKRYPPKR